MKRTCVYTDTDNHSQDILAVHHGRPDGPTYICGYHEQSRGLPCGHREQSRLRLANEDKK